MHFLSHNVIFLDGMAYALRVIEGKLVIFNEGKWVIPFLKPQSATFLSPSTVFSSVAMGEALSCSSFHLKPQNPNPTRLMPKTPHNFSLLVVSLCT